MTQNEKDLLLKDLCARLPYRVMCRCDEIKVEGILKEIGVIYNICKLYDSFTDEFENCYIFDCKPYLFPLSSMTEEQKEEYCSLQQRVIYNSKGLINSDVMEYVNWCYKNHIDINDLIPMGLAEDATGLNIY